MRGWRSLFINDYGVREALRRRELVCVHNAPRTDPGADAHYRFDAYVSPVDNDTEVYSDIAVYTS